MTTHVNEAKEFTPKEPPKLKPPKDDFISVEALSACDGKTLSYILHQPNVSDLKNHSGTSSANPIYVAVKGTVFDVSGNEAYASSGAYHSMIYRQSDYV